VDGTVVQADDHKKKSQLSIPEYALSLIVLFGGWMVALFGIAGQVRPAGVMAFAIATVAGLGFVLFSWFIYETNIQTFMWVADLMEDRVLRVRQNWQNETLRSLVEVGSWLHITFRIYSVTESTLAAAFCGAVVGAFCVVLGDYFTEFAHEAEHRLLAHAEHGFAGYRVLQSLSRNYRSIVDSSSTMPPNRLLSKNRSSSDGVRDEISPREELISILCTPQFASLGVAFVFAASLYHFKDSQDLGIAVILTTLANVAFITAEQLLMLWRPTKWAGIILHDRVLNVVYNWQHETIRSGFETSFYLTSIFLAYSFTENVPASVLGGTFAGMFIVLCSSRIGVGKRTALDEKRRRDTESEQGMFMLAIFGWACATLLYTIFTFSRSSLLALCVLIATCVAITCLAEMAVKSIRVEPEDDDCVNSKASTCLKSKWSVFQFAFGSLLFPLSREEEIQSRLPRVSMANVNKMDHSTPPHLEGLRRLDLKVLTMDDIKGKPCVIIEGYVIDVGAFASHHPGGDALLLDYASKQSDVTDHFAAFHNPAIYKRLPSMAIGKLDEQKEVSNQTQEYRKLRNFLWKEGYFGGAENDLGSAKSCAHHHLIVFSLAMLAVCQVALLGYKLKHDGSTIYSYIQAIAAGVTLGFFWQQSAFIAHDALHNGVVNRTKEHRSSGKLVPHNLLGWFHGSVCFGISSAMWLDEHNVHHAMTMRPCEDPQFNYLPLWCVSVKEFATENWQKMRENIILRTITPYLIAVQDKTIFPLAIFIGRFNFCLLNIVYAVKNKVYFDLLGMLAFWCTFSGLLMQLSGNPCVQVLFVLSSHWTVGILHIQLLINHLATDAFTAEEEAELGFFTFQILTTRNIDSTEDTDWFHGGLQYQYEHHLFPQLPRHRLALVKPAIQDICASSALKYESVPFFTAVQDTVLNFSVIAKEVWDGNLAN